MCDGLIWENKVYARGLQANVSPYTEVFSFLARTFGESAKGKRLLEIGCGVGNNLLFARWAMDFDVYGIDLSKTAIKVAKMRFKRNKLVYQELKVGNVINIPYPDGYFDVVIDRAAIQHNTVGDIQKIIAELHRVLKPHGRAYSGVSSPKDKYYRKGMRIEGNTYVREDVGTNHFFSRREIVRFYSKLFKIDKWFHAVSRDMKDGSRRNGVYQLEMTKKTAVFIRLTEKKAKL